jgi:general secretion pathway protein A
MSYEESAAAGWSPFNAIPDARNLYLAPQHREVLATLRYGIEARKGFMLCVGDAGTGKSTLLQRLSHELDPSVTFVVIPDAHESVIEVYRSLLRGLGMEPASASQTELIQQCRTILRAQAAAGRIVAIAFDNAHHMSDEVIELVRQNLIGTGQQSAFRQLAQVVLAGRPEFRERFLRPPLRWATVPVALECALSALSDSEVGEYIEYRLRSADLPVDMFDGAALQGIAHYSGGRLHLINALCDRAFLTADHRARKHIGAAWIDSAAKDLDLWQPRWARKDEPEKHLAMPRGRDNALRFQFTANDPTERVGHAVPHLSGAANNERWRQLRKSGALLLGALFCFTIAAGWMRRDLAASYLSQWSAGLMQMGGSLRQALERAAIPAQTAREAVNHAGLVSAPAPTANNPPPVLREDDSAEPGPSKIAREVTIPPLPMQANDSLAESDNVARTVAALAKRPASQLANERKGELALNIANAIQARAIAGIRVRIIGDVAYLDGQVATERQRRAAERAARDAAGALHVRNRIVVE